jgi:sugar/nucleoside kinase (ribokinase family)
MLSRLDFTPLSAASFAYVDCYELIEAPAVRAVDAARDAGVPLLANLGGSPLSPAVVGALRAHPRLVVQTNVDEAAHADASALAASLLAATSAAWVVVTAGAFGATALSPAQELIVPAFRAAVRHTHLAGAAFSGGLIYGLLRGWAIHDSLTLACASGSLQCERGPDEALPAMAELEACIQSRERIRHPDHPSGTSPSP